jgi:hypothetical protein
MEGEFNFLSFLPLETQQQVRKHWYRGSVSEVEEFVYQGNQANVKTNIQYSSDNPLNEFYGILQKHLANTFNQVQDVQPSNFANASHRALSKINQVAGKGASLMSESTIVQIITNQGESRFYTLLRHSAYTNISHLFNEEDRRLPEEDRLTITQGFATSHPNTFMRVMEKDLTDFSTEISQLKDEQSYTNLMDKFGVRRTAQDFWAYADEMHLYFSKTYPLDFGLLDFNRLENR